MGESFTIGFIDLEFNLIENQCQSLKIDNPLNSVNISYGKNSKKHCSYRSFRK